MWTWNLWNSLSVSMQSCCDSRTFIHLHPSCVTSTLWPAECSTVVSQGLHHAPSPGAWAAPSKGYGGATTIKDIKRIKVDSTWLSKKNQRINKLFKGSSCAHWDQENSEFSSLICINQRFLTSFRLASVIHALQPKQRMQTNTNANSSAVECGKVERACVWQPEQQSGCDSSRALSRFRIDRGMISTVGNPKIWVHHLTSLLCIHCISTYTVSIL